MLRRLGKSNIEKEQKYSYSNILLKFNLIILVNKIIYLSLDDNYLLIIINKLSN